MPQAQNWNKSQSLQSTLFFFLPSFSHCACLSLSSSHWPYLVYLPPTQRQPSSFLLLLFISCLSAHVCLFFFSTFRSTSFSCVLLFFSEMLCCRDETSGYIYKKAKQSDTAGSNKRENLFSACNWKQHHSESLCFPIAKINFVCPWCRGAVELRNGMANVQVIEGWFITTKQATMKSEELKFLNDP